MSKEKKVVKKATIEEQIAQKGKELEISKELTKSIIKEISELTSQLKTETFSLADQLDANRKGSAIIRENDIINLQNKLKSLIS